MPQTVRTTLEQGRAKYAYECAERGAELGTKASEYRAYAKKIPMLIKTNGLGATFAFIKSKGGATYNLIYEQTTKWIGDHDLFKGFNDKDDLVKYIISLDSTQYRAMAIEVLALFSWMRRFAEGLITKD